MAYNSRHCWMLQVAAVCTPCYMLLRKIETGQTLQTTQHCWPITPNTVTSVWTQLYVILENGLLYKTRAYDWGFKPNANGHNNKCWELSPFARSQKFDRFQSLRNNSQQHSTTCHRMCNRTRHVTSNNVSSVFKGHHGTYSTFGYCDFNWFTGKVAAVGGHLPDIRGQSTCSS